MGRACRVLTLALLAGPFLGPDVAAATSKLSKSDRQWLEQVATLITSEEIGLFEQIDARDRERFQEIFWARRDPDPRTPHNELRASFEARRRLADQRFRQAGLSGSATDMGRVFLLLGPPARVAHSRIKSGGGAIDEEEECDVCDVELESSLLMMVGPTAGLEETSYVTWRYGPDPLLGLPRGLDVEFRSQSTFGYRLVASEEVERALARARRLCICDSAAGYELDEAGRLTARPASDRPVDALGRALNDAPDPSGNAAVVVFRAIPSFFAAEGGASFVPLLLEIEPDSLTWNDGVAEVTVSGCVDAGKVEPLDRFRLRAGLARDTGGRVRFDLPFTLSPGRHKLRLAVQDDASARVGERVLDLVVPDFGSGTLMMSSVVAYVEATEAEPSPVRAGRAFQFGRLRVAPRYEFRRDHKIGLLYFVYGLDEAAPRPPVVQYAFFREGELCGQTGESALAVSGTQAIGNTEIPLQSLAPGAYTLVVAVTDRVSDTMVSRSVRFELEDAPP